MTDLLRVWWRALDLLGRVERAVGIALIAIMVVTITVQVISRYGWGRPIVWVEELATYAFIWAVFLGAAAAAKEVRHIRIETFVGRIGPRGRAFSRATIAAIMLLVSVIVAVTARDIMTTESRSQTISLPINVGRHWVYSVPLFTCLVSLALTSAYFLAAHLHEAVTGTPVLAEVEIAARARRLRAEADAEADLVERAL